VSFTGRGRCVCGRFWEGQVTSTARVGELFLAGPDLCRARRFSGSCFGDLCCGDREHCRAVVAFQIWSTSSNLCQCVKYAANSAAAKFEMRSAKELLTHSVWESAPGDEAAGQVQEASVDVGVAFPPFGQAPVLVQRGEGVLDDPARGLVFPRVPRRSAERVSWPTGWVLHWCDECRQ
jgi:hypothetical protein